MTSVEDELRTLREQQLQERVEQMRREEASKKALQQKADLLNTEARRLLAPYVEAVKRSRCVEAMQELALSEGLSIKDPELASPDVSFFVAFKPIEGHRGAQDHWYERFRGLDLAGGFYWDSFKVQKLKPGNLRPLSGQVMLEWGYFMKHVGGEDEPHWDQIRCVFDQERTGFVMTARTDHVGGYGREHFVGRLHERGWGNQAVERLVAQLYLHANT
ncbi:MAG: hypothetical protein A3F04_00050 [Candidatus Chisholmbacteria bacterium RIFCSPHIGHO2_12_FULL_49_9]|uniref:Uncharacterized protein n=1 Tax=Candidatus Chisholmbacteria bacterium RIFCSPHIGHO2_01_FULL_52_32 TaxID=1797591 RepID=A0A1G1VS71_9BACT|nr:MAG: hypothetical protein A2786_01850 [Candidatus Chisholmbacteria bacterium RIFCSPHIGHO2_01_FULL_52_32]OGY19266.1 MAG: hypothetical protein A3F04_00050 [Candidatus Chisholmbacteria bacterium RIFCSPHIGHO2_12_FULL_49_9]OGY20384.1 MAG: hypothetical protein A2900_04890 [Candidatus Chisholmbacteria bacterium RIFCSPLOWO2_01_FULL_50_28]